MRWHLIIEEFNPEIICMKVQNNIIADALSWLDITPLSSTLNTWLLICTSIKQNKVWYTIWLIGLQTRNTKLAEIRAIRWIVTLTKVIIEMLLNERDDHDLQDNLLKMKRRDNYVITIYGA